MDVNILMYRVERKPGVAACEHQRRRPAYTPAQFVVRSLESKMDKLSQTFSTLANRIA